MNWIVESQHLLWEFDGDSPEEAHQRAKSWAASILATTTVIRADTRKEIARIMRGNFRMIPSLFTQQDWESLPL